MKREPLPFMGTHVANIALNKQLGLVFLLSEPQKTYGLTAVSHESMRNDQLQVARGMILHFIGSRKDERQPEPWVRMLEWRVKLGEVPDPDESDSFDEALRQIYGKARALDNIWNSENEEARVFLLRLAVQINECVGYTNRRIEAIKLCLRLAGLGRNPDPVEYQEELLSAGPKLAKELIDACEGLSDFVAEVGYLGIKNSVPALYLFARDLLELVRNLLADEAVKRGYVSPIAPAQPIQDKD